MSLRNLRKLYGNNSLPPPEDDSDGDYEPLYTQKKQSTYEGLILSDTDSDDEPEKKESDNNEDGAAAAVPGPSGAYGNKKKNKKKKAKAKKLARIHKDDGLDEIDRSLRDVNAMLGAPPPAPPVAATKVSQSWLILGLDPKHLNVANESRRLFGPDEPDQNRRGRSHSQRIRILRRVMVGPMKDTVIYDFVKSGLSMSIQRQEKGRTYFVYDHDVNYQKYHRSFLYHHSSTHSDHMLFQLEESRSRMHIEALLEISDLLFRMEEPSSANETVENVVTYLQYVAHPAFNLASSDTRLEYKFLENRPFHVAMLKYMYLLTNKAYHRTALEICKMLLSLDPSDPLAVLFVIDSIALKAREHQWLIEACDFFDRHREAGSLFNMQYSSALALFHLAKKGRRDTQDADEKLRTAMLSYPQVTVSILRDASMTLPMMATHPVFRPEPITQDNKALDELIFIYVKLTISRWREPEVLEWFMNNVRYVCEHYTNTARLRRQETMPLFRVLPIQVKRHFSVIRHMADLLFEAPMAAITRPTCGWDPLYDLGTNRYEYPCPMMATHPSASAEGGSALISYSWADFHLALQPIGCALPSRWICFTRLHTAPYVADLTWASSIPAAPVSDEFPIDCMPTNQQEDHLPRQGDSTPNTPQVPGQIVQVPVPCYTRYAVPIERSVPHRPLPYTHRTYAYDVPPPYEVASLHNMPPVHDRPPAYDMQPGANMPRPSNVPPMAVPPTYSEAVNAPACNDFPQEPSMQPEDRMVSDFWNIMGYSGMRGGYIVPTRRRLQYGGGMWNEISTPSRTMHSVHSVPVDYSGMLSSGPPFYNRYVMSYGPHPVLPNSGTPYSHSSSVGDTPPNVNVPLGQGPQDGYGQTTGNMMPPNYSVSPGSNMQAELGMPSGHSNTFGIGIPAEYGMPVNRGVSYEQRVPYINDTASRNEAPATQGMPKNDEGPTNSTAVLPDTAAQSHDILDYLDGLTAEECEDYLICVEYDWLTDDTIDGMAAGEPRSCENSNQQDVAGSTERNDEEDDGKGPTPRNDKKDEPSNEA